MNTIEPSPVSGDLADAVRAELARARCGRLFASYSRREATALERDAARVARAAGLPVVEIAHAIGVSVPRAYQLLSDPKRSA